MTIQQKIKLLEQSDMKYLALAMQEAWDEGYAQGRVKGLDQHRAEIVEKTIQRTLNKLTEMSYESMANGTTKEEHIHLGSIVNNYNLWRENNDNLVD